MKSPKAVRELVAPFLDLLGKKIRERGYTELEIEEALSWNRRHIGRLMAGLESLHVHELLSILGVIGLEPGAFYAELYGMPPRAEGPRSRLAPLPDGGESDDR